MFLQFPRRKLIVGRGTELAFTAMFLALGGAMVDAIYSVYLDGFVNNNALVGTLSGVIALATAFFYLISPPILKRFSETKIWSRTLFFTMVGYTAFYFITNIWIFMTVAIIMSFFAVLRSQAHGILVRDLYTKKQIASGQGLQYSLFNAGYMIGPLIAGFAAANFGIRSIFLLVVALLIIAYILFKMIHLKDINRFTKDTHIIRNIRDFLNKKGLKKAYLLRGGITMYWGLIYIFMPLFIIQSGLHEYWIGIFLFSVAVPLVIFEYHIGKRADNAKLKKFFLLGYAILAIAGLSAFIFANIYIWMIIFFFASIGAALLEPNTETYFFRLVHRNEEEKFYGPFSTSSFLLGAIAKFLAGGVLAIFVARQYVFLLMFVLMASMFLVSITVKH